MICQVFRDVYHTYIKLANSCTVIPFLYLLLYLLSTAPDYDAAIKEAHKTMKAIGPIEEFRKHASSSEEESDDCEIQ